MQREKGMGFFLVTGCSLVCGGAFGRFSSNVLGQGFGLVSHGVHKLAGDERVWLLVEFRGCSSPEKRENIRRCWAIAHVTSKNPWPNPTWKRIEIILFIWFPILLGKGLE